VNERKDVEEPDLQGEVAEPLAGFVSLRLISDQSSFFLPYLKVLVELPSFPRRNTGFCFIQRPYPLLLVLTVRYSDRNKRNKCKKTRRGNVKGIKS